MPADIQVSSSRDWLRAHQALLILAGCLAAGLLAIAVAALKAEAPASWASVAAFGLATSGASIFVGGLIGFLFGIPRRLQQQEEAKPAHAADDANAAAATQAAIYGANTNLEQISDWLTKILVGVGLINIAGLKTLLPEVSVAVAPGFGGQVWSGTFGVVIIVYFFVGGFLIGYLTTRLYLGQALTAAERTFSLQKQLSRLEEQSQTDALALQLATTQLSGLDADKPTQQVLDNAVRGTSGEMKAQIFYRAQLQRLRNWRDDTTKPKMERTIPVFRALAASDSQDSYHKNYGELGYALKDQRTPDWAGAEEALTRAIALRGDNFESSYYGYEMNRAHCRIMRDESYRSNAPSSDEVKAKIVEDLKAGMKDEATKAWALKMRDLAKWVTLNKLDFNALP
ncbi:hypothetical protein [Methyloceanibacter sp.]|uniref:hypothetical protein n=1 Tax=Methyloceanibacter sp. TaxID=1965321 RepID=UPI003D6D42F5